MNSLPEPTAINEINADALRADPARWIQAAQPWVARSLVDGWPLVSAANEGDSAFLDYLLSFYSGNQVSAFLGEAEIGGRFFYNEALDGFNFLQVQTTLNNLSEQLRTLATDGSPPSLYMGSTNLDHWLPGLSATNPLPIDLTQPLASLWLCSVSIRARCFCPSSPNGLPRRIAGSLVVLAIVAGLAPGSGPARDEVCVRQRAAAPPS